MFEGRVLGRIKDLTASKDIKSLLRIDLHLRNETGVTFEIVNLMAHVDIGTSKTGRFPDQQRFYLGRAHPWMPHSTLAVRGEGSWHFCVELDPALIHRLEEFRQGRNIFLFLTGTVVAIERSGAEPVAKRIATDQVYDDEVTSNSFCTYGIPKSRWLELLKDLGYREYYTAEMPLPRIRQSRLLGPSLAHLQRAWESFHDGRDRETLAACYDALELVARKLGYAQPDQNAYGAMLAQIGEQTKIRKLAVAFDSCTNFLHLGRHEDEPSVSLEHKDAELALLLTHACVAYVSKTEVAPKKAKVSEASRNEGE